MLFWWEEEESEDYFVFRWKCTLYRKELTFSIHFPVSMSDTIYIINEIKLIFYV